MQYKLDTLKRYAEKCKIAMDDAKNDIGAYHVRVSYGNKKIGKTLNFNTLAIFGGCGGMCGKCGCFKYCYAIKDAIRFPAVLRSRAINTVLSMLDRDRYFNEIAEQIKRHKSYKFIRFHVSGEIRDIDYLIHMIDIAKQFPDRIFWTYTKQYGIVNAYCDQYGKDSIPANLTIMFSEWDGYPMDNKYHFPEFHFIPKGRDIPQNVFICPGNCDYCKQHNCGCVNGCTAYVHEH